jgi:general secretion pathway protein D
MKRNYHCVFLTILAICMCEPKARSQVNASGIQDSNLQSMPKVLPRIRSMQLNGSVTDVIQQAFRLYNMDVLFVGPIQGLNRPVEVNLRDADVSTTGRVLDAMTHCFFVPINAHLILAVQDDKEHRQQYERVITATIEIPNLDPDNAQEKTEVQGLLSTVFGIQKATVKGNTVTVHAPKRDVLQAEETLTHLFLPPPQILLEVKAYLVSRGHNRDVGVDPPQQITVFNVESELENLINSNSSVVAELIASGLVSAGDTLGIAEALVAEGYGSSSVLTSPFVYFGGGNTMMGVQFGSVDANMTLSGSTSQQLQDAMLHLANDQQGTLKVGQRYPIMTESTSTLGGSSSSTTPTIDYEDIGLVLEAKPHIEAGGEVSLHLHETFRSLDGTGVDSIPILDNQEFVSDLSVPAGVTTVVVSSLSRTETRTAQGLVSFLPTDSAKNQQTSDLVVTITPILTRARSDSR